MGALSSHPLVLLDRVALEFKPEIEGPEWSQAIVAIAEGVMDTWSGAIIQIGFILSGKVTDATTGQPIVGVAVRIDTRQTDTAQDGSYSFDGLQAKTYTVLFTKSGYQPITKSVTISKDTVLNITMAPPLEEGEINWLPIALIGGGALAAAAIILKKKKPKPVHKKA